MTVTLPDSPELTARAAAEGHADVAAYVRALVHRDLEVAAIEQGIADVEAGRVQSLGEAMAEIRAELGLPPREPARVPEAG